MTVVDKQKEDGMMPGTIFDCKPFQDGGALAAFLKNTFPITDKEADMLLGYMEGHGFILGKNEEQLYRGDICCKQNDVSWETYSIDDAINDAFEWNDELIQSAMRELDKPKDALDNVSKKSNYDSLCEDEKVLYDLFYHTKYGKE